MRSTLLGLFLLCAVSIVMAHTVSSFYVFTLNRCLLAVIGAIALNLLMGNAGLMSIGNSAFLACGAFGTVFALNLGVPLPWNIILAALASAIAGLVVCLPAFRIQGLYLSLATLSAYFIVINVVREYQTHSDKGGSGGFFVTPLFAERGLDGAQQAWTVLLLILLVPIVIFAVRISQEKSGRAWRMIRDHEIAAACLGIPVMRYKMLAFGVSSGLVGLAGGLMAYLSGTVNYETFTFNLAIAYVAMVLVGGIDSVGGAVVGAFLITALPVLTPKAVTLFMGAESATTASSGIALIVYGVLIVVFVTSSPRGLAGLFKDLSVRYGRGRTSGRGGADVSRARVRVDSEGVRP